MVATSVTKETRSRHHSVVATSVALKGGRDIIKRPRHQLQRLEVATSLRNRDNRRKEKRSRHHLEVATSVNCHDIICKERRSRHHLAVATSDPRNVKVSRDQVNFCDVAETTEVATKNRCRNINNQLGQLN